MIFNEKLTKQFQGSLLKNASFTKLNMFMKNIKTAIRNPVTEKNKYAVLESF